MEILVGKKIGKIVEILDELRFINRERIAPIEILEAGYRDKSQPPEEGYERFENGDQLDGSDKHYWVRFTVDAPVLPDGFQNLVRFKTGREHLWDAINPQGLVFLNGKISQGIDIHHTEALIEPGKNEIIVSLHSGNGSDGDRFNLDIFLETLDKRVEKAYYDILVPYRTAMIAEDGDETGKEILKYLEIAVNKIDFRAPGSEEFYKTLGEAVDYLENEFYKKACGKTEKVVNCIGHTHIDVAWLWTLEQTIEKTQRSFSTVLNLMRQYPEYIFMSSQPQLYAFVKEYAPDVYEEIKERIKECRWEAEGAMWLEADCNLSSGESLVRQIIHGKRFMKEELGVDSKTLWLPDVFGYSAALPQILNKTGVENFVTSKISWNDTNRMPYDTFIWQGIDGTEIFSNFMTAQKYVKGEPSSNFSTYVGMLDPEHVKGAWNRYQQKEFNTETVLTFGFGDGGGGPTREMLEMGRRLKYGIPGLPKAEITTSAEYLKKTRANFFKSTEDLKRIPKWVGELYLELHRGTYTSISKNKKNNRRSEFELQNAEALSEIASLLFGADYPAEELYGAWQNVLLNQFHDIIPGSSIEEVYDRTDKDYAEVLATADSAQKSALGRIAENIKTDGGVLVYNPTSFNAEGIIELEGEIYETEAIAPFGWSVITPEKAEQKVKVSGLVAENDYYILSLDKEGRIESLYDKRNDREIVLAGEKANELQTFEDYPYAHDNWDICPYYKQKMWIIDNAEITPFSENACGGFIVKRKYMNSYIEQKICLYNNCERIDFKTKIDWHEHHQVLKVAFPLDIKASKATYDIQYGNIERPTHYNTSWDAAKFEVVGHKWADISDSSFGVALLNDCKYGHSAEGSTLKLTLLKCGTYPNENADQGEQELTYSLLPHEGDYREGEVIKQAYLLNNPFKAISAEKCEGELPESYSFVSADKQSVVIEAIKKAYDSDDTIVRLYDAFDRREKVKLTFGFEPKAVYLCDMLENEISEIPFEGNEVTLPLKNYEIVTLKIKA